MPLHRPPEQRRPQPSPLRTDDRRVVLVGTAVWGLLLAVTLVVREDLVAAGRDWWSWSCAAGVALGLVGLLYLHRRQADHEPRDGHPDGVSGRG